MIKVSNPNLDSVSKSNNSNKVIATDVNQLSAAGGNEKKVANYSSAQVNAARFERWANWGVVQQKNAQAQSAERSLTNVYRELVSIERSLNLHVKQPQKTVDSLKQLQHKVSDDLSSNLQPKVLSKHAQQSQFVLNSVDLFSVKPAETINMVLPTAGKSVSFHLPEGAGNNEVVGLVAKALAPLNIGVAKHGDKQLSFSINQGQSRQLAEPVLFSGEGIRIPAGNPVPVQLQEQKPQLEQLAKSIEQDPVTEIKAKITAMQNDVKRSIAALRYIMSQIQQETAQVAYSGNIEEVQTELSQLLRQGDFGSRLTGLLAQANISRDTAVSLLQNNNAR
ncbi:hypothetical protein [Thalassotalea sp. PLHSN55]|uniref:hypothetical protein n=1 Tax=Thalassotalea sp. PLHSN55 TaxID=3435888 RepID=UPI003F85A7D9